MARRDDGPARPADVAAALDAPPPAPPPAVGSPKRTITTEQYIKKHIQHKPYRLLVDGKVVGEYDEFLTHTLPRV